MSEVLVDLYTIFEFDWFYDQKVKDSAEVVFRENFSLIENLILCDKLVVESNGVSYHRLSKICNTFSDSFRFIEDNRLYDRTSFENTVIVGTDIDQRGLVYADVANENEIYYSPHPEREKLLTNTIQQYVDKTAVSVIEQFDQKFNESRSGVVANINVQIPPIVEHVLFYAKAQNITVAESINEIRNSKNATLFRNYFSDLDAELKELSPRKKIPVYQKLFQEINHLCVIWEQDMDSEVLYKKRNINLTRIPILGKLFDLAGLGEVTINDPILLANKQHLLFINDLYQK